MKRIPVVRNESGVFGAQPARLPLSIGDPTLVSGASSVTSIADLFMLYLQGGLVDVALLGGAQIDRYGNLNTTVIGDYAQPKIRLPGSGGACEIAINAREIFMIMRLGKRAFVDKLDFVTSPGHLDGGDARARAGLPGAGPQLVITNRGLFDFDNEAREMTLIEVAPEETAASIQSEVGWPLRISPNLRTMTPPAAAIFVLTMTVATAIASETEPSASCEPPLKPNQPTQSNPVPMTAMERSNGARFSLP